MPPPLTEPGLRSSEKSIKAMPPRPPGRLPNEVLASASSASKNYSRDKPRKGLTQSKINRLNSTDSAHLRRPSADSGPSSQLGEEEVPDQAAMVRRGNSLMRTGLEIMRKNNSLNRMVLHEGGARTVTN